MADATRLSVMIKQIEDNKQATDDLKAQMADLVKSQADLCKSQSHMEAMLSMLVSQSRGQTSHAPVLNLPPSGCLTTSTTTSLKLPKPPDPPDMCRFEQGLTDEIVFERDNTAWLLNGVVTQRSKIELEVESIETGSSIQQIESSGVKDMISTDLVLNNGSTSEEESRPEEASIHKADSDFAEEAITSNTSKPSQVSLYDHLPLFDGTLPDCWIVEVDRFFELEQYENEEKLNLISLSVEGAALKWFKRHRREFTDWTDIKRKLMARFGSEKEPTDSVEITSIKGHEVQGTTVSHVRQFDVTTIADAVGCCESSLLQHSSATQSRAPFSPYQSYNDQPYYERKFGECPEIEFDRESDEIKDVKLQDKQPEEDVKTLVISENKQSLECVGDEPFDDEKPGEVIVEVIVDEPVESSAVRGVKSTINDVKFHLKHKWRSKVSQSFSELKQGILVSLGKSLGYLMEAHGSKYEGLVCALERKKLRTIENDIDHLKKLLATMEGLAQKISCGLLCGNGKFHLKHKWKSKLIQALSGLQFGVDNIVPITSHVKVAYSVLGLEVFVENVVLFTGPDKLLFSNNHKLLHPEIGFCTQYNHLELLSTEHQSSPGLDYFTYLNFIWKQVLSCGCEAGHISSRIVFVGGVHGLEAQCKRLLVLNEISLLDNDNKVDFTIEASWFYNKPTIREVFHLQRPPELIYLQGNPNFITKVPVQWKEHPPDQFFSGFYEQVLMLSSLRTRMFRRREYCDRINKLWLIWFIYVG